MRCRPACRLAPRRLGGDVGVYSGLPGQAGPVRHTRTARWRARPAPTVTTHWIIWPTAGLAACSDCRAMTASSLLHFLSHLTDRPVGNPEWVALRSIGKHDLLNAQRQSGLKCFAGMTGKHWIPLN